MYDPVIFFCSACTYDASDKLISCNQLGDNTKLHGYEIVINVVEYEADFKYWRGVESCEVLSIVENTVSYLDNPIFKEKFVLKYKRPPFKATAFHAMVLLCLISLVLYVALYMFRKDNCVVCGKKLILSCNRCVVCIALGAEPPDDALLKALSEKGTILTDESTGDVCCMDCRCCTARGRLVQYHVKRSAKIHSINVAMAEGKIDGPGYFENHLLQPIEYQNRSAKLGEVAEVKVDEELLYRAAGHPMYAKPIEIKYKYGAAHRPVDPKNVFPMKR
jgi:hypothetical protein